MKSAIRFAPRLSSLWLVAAVLASGVGAQKVAGATANPTRPLVQSARPHGAIDVRSFGAIGDGVHDDTAAFQRAIQAAREGASRAVLSATGQESMGSGWVPGITLWVPQGTYVISETLTVECSWGFQILGSGIGTTTLLWSGPAATPAFVLRDSGFGFFEGFTLGNASAEPLASAFLIESGTDAVCVSQSHEFRRIYVDGGVAGVQRAIRFTVADGVVKSNAGHVLDRVVVRNYLEAGYSLESDTVRGLMFRDCRFEGESRGLAGLATNLGSSGEGSAPLGGAFRWIGGGGGSNRGADFDLGDVCETILISAARFSGSARFLNTAGPSGNQWPVIVESVVWLDDMLGEYADAPWAPEEGLRIVNFQFRGPLTLTGNQFGVPPDPLLGPFVAKEAQIIWNPGGNFGQFNYVGNYLASSKDNPFRGPTATGAVVGIYPTTQYGNLIEPEDFGSSQVLQMKEHVTSLSGSATPSVGWLHTSRRLFLASAGTPISDLAHGVLGQEVVISALGDRTLLHGTSLRLSGGQDFAMSAGDNITLIMLELGVWSEVARTQS